MSETVRATRLGRRGRRARPSLLTRRAYFRVTDEQFAMLKRWSELSGKSMAALVREIIDAAQL